MSDTTQRFRLSRLGLQQELKRSFDLLACFGLSFTIQSPLVGVSVGMTYSWTVGGPAPASWGWVIVSFGSMFIGLSMAEIVSALPASGGPFFWSSWLGGEQGPVLSFVTGWLNLFGQLALSTGNAGIATSSVANMVSMMTGASLSSAHQLLVQLGILFLGGAVNTCQPRTVARFLALGIFINFAGVIFVVLLLPAVAPWHQSPKFVWTTFFDKSLSPNEVPSNAYLWVQGLCMGLFTIAGYDCCSHISEETKGADSSTPLAILWSIVASAVVGYVLLLGLLFCVQDQNPWALLNPDSEAQGFAAGQLVWDVFKARFGSGMGSASVLCIWAVSGIMCTAASLTSNSRCLFAFARSRAVPFSSFCKHVSQRTHMPTRAVWVAVACASAMSLPLLTSSIALGMLTAVAYASLLLSYGIPILCRLTIARHSFEPGPFHLGRFSMLIGWIALGWTITSSVVLCLPSTFPMVLDNSPLALGIVLFGSIAAWYAPSIGAKKWYLDPRKQAKPTETVLSTLLIRQTTI